MEGAAMNSASAVINEMTMVSHRLHHASLSSRGTVLHFLVSLSLLVLLPLLFTWYLFSEGIFQAGDMPSGMKYGWYFAVLGIGTGLLMLARYPFIIIKLRRNLNRMSVDDFFTERKLLEWDKDIFSINDYMNVIVSNMKKRLLTIERQQQALMDAERQRVMLESIAAACHHLGQPATVLSTGLSLLDRAPLNDEQKKDLSLCKDAADKLRDILLQLQTVSAYRTVPYCSFGEGSNGVDVRMIDISSDGGAELP
jgi:signal transduction histidine kinase